jgi:serine/threonine protein kinase
VIYYFLVFLRDLVTEMKIWLAIFGLIFVGCSNSDDSNSSSNPSGKVNAIKDDAQIDVIRKISEYKAHIERRSSQWASLTNIYLGDCPVVQFRIGDDEYSINKGISPKEGSGTLVYETVDGTKMVKHSYSFGMTPYSWADEAALLILNDSSVGPRLYTPSYRKISKICDLSTFVMEKAGSLGLAEKLRNGLVYDRALIAEIGIRIIDLVELIHKRGIVHGDIHLGNFVYSGSIESLQVIDFGRSKPYIQLDGSHISDGTEDSSDQEWNPVLLSPFELSGSNISRRDDIFRIAELLVNMIDGVIALVNIDSFGGIALPSISEMIKRKRNRKFSSSVPKQVVEVYRMSLDMKFDEAPRYDQLRSILGST